VRLAVAHGPFPLYEVFQGSRHRIHTRPDGAPPDARLRWQARFSSPALNPGDRQEQIKEARLRREAPDKRSRPPRPSDSTSSSGGHGSPPVDNRL